MDHRMINRSYDWYVRLPLVLLCFAFPNRRLLAVAHAINAISWFDHMPAVWDYMCWCAIMEVTFVAAACVSSSMAETARKFLPAMRAQLVVLYFSAAFWKLTTSWFDGHYSCSTVLTSELLAGLELLFPPLSAIGDVMLYGAPALVAGIEFAVPALLLFQPRHGVLLALIFHQTINLMPATYAGGFSIAMCARLIIFLPAAAADAQDTLMRGVSFAPRALAATALVGVTTAVMLTIHSGMDSHAAIYLILAHFYFLSLAAPWGDLLDGVKAGAYGELRLPEMPFGIAKMVLFVLLVVFRPLGDMPSAILGFALLLLWGPHNLLTFVREHAFDVTGGAVVSGFGYGFVAPILGLMMMASSTMYGNVQNFGQSNHLLVTTGLLQNTLSQPEVAASAPAWLVDLFGGGFVRVDHTTSKAFRKLAVKGAEMTEKLPLRAREILSSYNASGRYFEFYAARNYFERPEDLDKTALNAIKADYEEARNAADDPPYVILAYELRRVLHLARIAGEDFSLQYTPMPPELTTPSQWKAYRGDAVVLRERGTRQHKPADHNEHPIISSEVSEVISCRVGNARECTSTELALQPPPNWWLMKFLHPYPIPLLDGSGDGIHCST
uniref:HTTM domain-containing protein n=1 Tax=Haptolina brevifila TaxID=156173 RepID=A0A7S2CKL5_9EUKA